MLQEPRPSTAECNSMVCIIPPQNSMVCIIPPQNSMVCIIPPQTTDQQLRAEVCPFRELTSLGQLRHSRARNAMMGYKYGNPKNTKGTVLTVTNFPSCLSALTCVILRIVLQLAICALGGEGGGRAGKKSDCMDVWGMYPNWHKCLPTLPKLVGSPHLLTARKNPRLSL